MIILCSKCGERFESLIVDRKLAMKELVTTSIDHVRRKHREIFEPLAMAIQKASTNLSCYMHFDECVVIPEDETFLREQIVEAQDIVMMALGYDPDEEEDEDELDDETENEDPLLGDVEIIEEEEDKENVRAS